jgi:hypothetical protein
VISTCNDQPSQQWKYDPFVSGYIKYAGDITKCIDLIGGGTTNGNNLQIWVSVGAREVHFLTGLTDTLFSFLFPLAGLQRA